VVAYPLLDLRRLGYFVKEYVFRIEAALLDTLADAGITGHRVRGAPGIYVRRPAVSRTIPRRRGGSATRITATSRPGPL
jgi:lipoate-protein ligase B